MPRNPLRQRAAPQNVRSLLDPEPAAYLRRVEDARDAGPARHEQPRHLRVSLARLGRGGSTRRRRRRGRLLLLIRDRRSLAPPLAEECTVRQELVREVPGQQLVARDALGRRGRRRKRRLRTGAESSNRRAEIRLAGARDGLSEERRRRGRRDVAHRLLRRRRPPWGGVVAVLPLLALPEEAIATRRLHRRARRQLDGPYASPPATRNGTARWRREERREEKRSLGERREEKMSGERAADMQTDWRPGGMAVGVVLYL
jgi:hypothetical protein